MLQSTPHVVPLRTREADRTQQEVLRALMGEFAALGLGGARIDSLAQRAGDNKRLIHCDPASKNGLFRAALNVLYLGTPPRKPRPTEPAEQRKPVPGLAHFHLSNNHTLSATSGRHLMAPKALSDRLSPMTEVVMGCVLMASFFPLDSLFSELTALLFS